MSYTRNNVILSGILSIITATNTVLIPSAWGQNSDNKYGFIYRQNAAQMWHYMWGYHSLDECEKAEENFKKAYGLNNSSYGNQSPIYSIVYDCYSDQRSDFQEYVDRLNRR